MKLSSRLNCHHLTLTNRHDVEPGLRQWGIDKSIKVPKIETKEGECRDCGKTYDECRHDGTLRQRRPTY